MPTNTRQDEARSLALQYLSERPSLAMKLSAVRSGIKREHSLDFSDGELTDALAVLVGQGWATAEFPGILTTKQYQATAAGVLAFERGQA